MRVYELAEKLKTTTRRILAASKALRLRKKYAVSALTEEQIKKITALVSKKKSAAGKKRAKKAARSAKKKVLKKASGALKQGSSGAGKAKKKAPPRKVFIDTGPPLPSAYGEETLVIMPKNPTSLFAYWELSRKISEQLIMRVYEIKGKSDKYYFDTRVNGNINNWYVNIPHAGAHYRAELGYIRGGSFIRLLSSNIVMSPRAGVSDEVDEEWMIVKEDLQDIIKTSGLDKASRSSLRKAQGSTRILMEILRGRVPGSSSGLVRKKKS